MTSPVTRPHPRWLIAVLASLALLAIVVPIILVRNAPRVAPVAAKIVRPHRVVPKQEIPEVDPVALQEVAAQDARAFNASVPFSTAPNPPARPFRLVGTPEDQLRAVDCLAAAVIYEAGDDASGERAVAQVVLNRMRHPAFPHTVCGVVFQGSERRTGCQFTFTCDGAMVRPVGAGAWDRARAIALAALSGKVDARVGQATHYHTDWVVPYWSASLDKITEVHTHLFFRWTGWWGTPAAFRSGYPGTEPNIPAMARLSTAHVAPLATIAGATDGLPLPAELVLPPGVAIPVGGVEQNRDSFLVTLDAKLGPEAFPLLAARACGDRPYCKFMAWTSKVDTPANLPVSPAQQRAMSYSYLRDQAFGFEKSLWNCTEFPRSVKGQCMKAQVSITMAAPPPSTFTYDATPGSALKGIAGAVSGANKPTEPEPLTGVRRKVDAPQAPAQQPLKMVPTLPAKPTND